MSKLEEMAEKEVPIRAWDDDITTDWCRQIYCLGANAVLKEIEPLVTTLRSGARKLFEEKFKELKGE